MKSHRPMSVKWNVMLLAARPLAISVIVLALFGVFAAPEHRDVLVGLGGAFYAMDLSAAGREKSAKRWFTNRHY